MRYIDKSTHLQEGLDLIHDFLDECCKDPDGRHSEVRYDKRDPGRKKSLSGSGYRSRLIPILIDNQGPYCCYCLRKLKSDRKKEEDSDECVTLEHIIPRGTAATDDISCYRTAPGLSDREVEIRETYESTGYTQKKFLHPHNVAYRNLVLSCAGTFPVVDDKDNANPLTPLCCNERRKEKEAYPIYLHSDAAAHVEYMKTGGIMAVQGKVLTGNVQTMIDNTELNCDSLRQIRRVWYLLRGADGKRISGIKDSDEKRDSLLLEFLFSDPNATDAYDLYEKFKKKEYWETLLLYRLFHDIMKAIP